MDTIHINLSKWFKCFSPGTTTSSNGTRRNMAESRCYMSPQITYGGQILSFTTSRYQRYFLFKNVTSNNAPNVHEFSYKRCNSSWQNILIYICTSLYFSLVNIFQTQFTFLARLFSVLSNEPIS